ncbi:LysR substrate-binding domain-containing protein [Gallaecimonas mangrovi]|uniref:LysR substrate-binding domain-containing protein n=1 Tax=Gallaecimonas mangrovi TaxID=2291597 RepID=UPI000E209CE8|nr:LysR substrate-binding domain-containing protein [Gallaecimonas mangrovi]
MNSELGDLHAFLAIAKAGGFREAARVTDSSASRLSDAVRRLETSLGVRLFHRTTRSVVLTDAGVMLRQRLQPALQEVEAALDVVNVFRDKPAGTLRLNVPVSAARLVLPSIVPAFLAQYPDIHLDIVANSDASNIIEGGFDAGIRYDEMLEQDMIAIPIGPRRQRAATAAAPALLDRLGRPTHPRQLLDFPCLNGRFSRSGIVPWEFAHQGEQLSIAVNGPLTVNVGAAMELSVQAAVAGTGVVNLFEQWLEPYLQSGQLEPILEPWWQWFSGPFLYYSGRQFVPAPLRAFIDFIKTEPWLAA